MRPSRNHINRLDLIPTYFKFHHFAGINIPFLDQAMPCHNNKKLPFAVVPMLPLRNPRFADINGNLSTILCMHKFRKGASIIHIHFLRICELFFWKVCQIQTEQLLCKRTFRHLRHKKRLGLLLKLFEQINNCSQSNLVRDRNAAILSLITKNRFDPVKGTVLLPEIPKHMSDTDLKFIDELLP